MRYVLSVALVVALVSGTHAGDDDPEGLFPVDPATGRYVFQEVVEIEGVAAGDLFSRARAWIANTYRSAQSVTQLEDSDAGRIIVKGLTQTGWMGTAVFIRHTLTIEVKDGRYRYTMTDFVFDQGIGGRPLEQKNVGKPGRKGILRRTVVDVEQLLASLEAAMRQTEDEDW